jgi:TP901 family phage tail tape measure protein
MAKDLNRSIKIYIDNSDAMKKADSLKTKISALDDELTKLNAAGKRETSEYQQKEKALIQLQASYDRYQQKISATEQVLKNLSGASREELEKTRRDIQGTLRKMSRDADGYQDTVKSLIAVEKQLNVVKAEQNGMLGKNATFWSRAADGFNKYFGMLTAFIATITGLSFAFRSLAEDVAKMDDIYADVMKTTGMTKGEVKALNEEFKEWDTRTLREDLNKIAEEGGRIGIAKNKIAEFTQAMDVANVALGDSFTGGVDEVTNKLGKLKLLFKETKDEQVEKAYMSIGSAINDLGANGVASEENIADFTTRVGSLPEALKPAIQDALGLGAAFEESGIEAEIGSRAYGIVLNRATTDAGNFGKVMGISKKEVEDLINTNPVEFFLKFSESMKGMNAVDTGKTLDALKINADGANKVIGAAANSTDRFRELLDMSNNSFKTGTSLINEFNIKNNTLAAKLDKSKKDFKEQALILGEKLNPVLLKSTDIVTYIIKLMPGLINFFSKYGGTILYLVSIIGAYTAAVKLNTLWNTNLKTAISLTNIQIKLKAAYMIAAEAATHLYWMTVSILTGRLSDARRSFIALSAVMKANPWGLALGAIVAVIGAIVLWNNHLAESKTKTDALIDITNEATKSITSEKAEVELLLSVAKNESISKAERLKAIKRLNEISPEYLGFLNLENINTSQTTEAVKLYTEELLRNAKAKAISNKITAIDEKIIGNQDEIDKAKKDIEDSKKASLLGRAIMAPGNKIQEQRISYYEKENEELEKQKMVYANLNTELVKNADLKKSSTGESDPYRLKTELTSLEKRKAALEQLQATQLKAQRSGAFGSNAFGFDQASELAQVNKEIEKRKDLLESMNSSSSTANKPNGGGHPLSSDKKGKTEAELQKEELDKKLKQLDDSILSERNKYAQQRLDNKISEDAYNAEMLRITQEAMERKMDILGVSPHQQKALLDLTLEYQKKYYLEVTSLEEEYRDSVKKSNKEASDSRIKTANDGMRKLDAKLKEDAQKQIEIEQSIQTAKQEILSNFLNAAMGLFHQNTVAYKAVAVAQATMDTYVAANKALAAYPPPYNFIAMGTVIAAGLVNVAKIVGLVKDGSSSSSSSGGSGTYAVNQAAAGKYDVIGQDDGKTYRDVPYAGVATSGIVTVPTLVGEQGTELIVSAPDFSKLQRHINYPLVVQAIKDAQAGTVPQRAQGKYDVIQQTPSSSGGNGQAAQGFDYDRIDKLVDALDKFTNKDLSVNYYSIEKAKTKVETSRSLGKKR